MQTHGATSATASPALLERLTDYCQTQAITLPALRRVFSGGAPVFPHLLDQMHNIAPHADIMALYGSSEAEPIAHIARAAIRAADRQEMSSGGGLLVGPPVEDIQVRVLQDRWGFPVGPFSASAFDALCCAPGEAGEIVVSGAHVLSGYVGGRGDAQTKFRVDGEVWHRTGDAGYLDEQGRLWLLGRCAARIDDARGRLYPFAVECAAAAHPVVRRAAVVAHQGQRVLTVERRTHADSTAALELDTLRAALAWAALDDIRCYPRLPVDRRHNAKIDYPALHAMLREG
jgi:acyl-CoA synthetase (AMP-forming)/AMP-acid ligase II